MSSESQPDARDRDVALDYMRAAALVLMSLVHMWRFLLGRSNAEQVLLVIGESAPSLFFVAFGMTRRRFLSRDRRFLSRLALFGLLAMFHSVFLLQLLTWEFFIFLWFSTLLIAAAISAGLEPRQLLVLAGIVLVLNIFVPLGVPRYVVLWHPTVEQLHAAELAARLWLLPPGPFYPLPWIVLPIFGFAIGMDDLKHDKRALALAALCLAIVFALGWLDTRLPGLLVVSRLAPHKLVASSTYMIGSCAWAVVVYALAGRVPQAPALHRLLYPPARFLSEHLLEGTVLHYLVVQIVEVIGRHWSVSGAAGWSTIVLLSAMNVGALFAFIALLTAVWRSIIPGAVGRLEAGVTSAVTVVALGLYITLRLAFLYGEVSRSSVAWLAYVAMLALACVYGSSRGASSRRPGSAYPV